MVLPQGKGPVVGSDNNITPPGLVAGEDLTAWQYKPVKFAATGGKIVACDTDGEEAIGILMNKPNTDQPARVIVHGEALAYVAIEAGYGGDSSADTTMEMWQELVFSDAGHLVPTDGLDAAEFSNARFMDYGNVDSTSTTAILCRVFVERKKGDATS